jgi:hypothetical protein
MRRRTMVLMGSLTLSALGLGLGGAPAVAGPQRVAGVATRLADVDRPVTGDWDGDGDATVGIWRGNTFHLRNDNSTGPANQTFAYGSSATDVPLAGDWDGDGTDTVGVFRTGTFYLRNTARSTTVVPFGFAQDIPVAGDWDGDGTTTIGVRRGLGLGLQWDLRNLNTAGPSDATEYFGRPADLPVVGDWDGDGTTTIGVRRGNEWHLRNSATSTTVLRYGRATDQPVTGDWDGDGDQTIGVVRGSTWFLRNTNSTGNADQVFSYTP